MKHTLLPILFIFSFLAFCLASSAFVNPLVPVAANNVETANRDLESPISVDIGDAEIRDLGSPKFNHGILPSCDLTLPLGMSRRKRLGLELGANYTLCVPKCDVCTLGFKTNTALISHERSDAHVEKSCWFQFQKELQNLQRRKPRFMICLIRRLR